MKVVKLTEWKHEAQCPGCKSDLLIEPDDVQFGMFGGGYNESGDATWFARCCVCGEPIFLFGHGDMKKFQTWIPKNVMDKARFIYEEKKKR